MKKIVIKYGGAAMQTPALMQAMMEDIAVLSRQDIHPIVVHGGGPEISKLCQQMGIVPKFVNGLRVTDSETMQIVQMVLIGKINKELVGLLNQKGVKAIGLSGHDANLLVASKAISSSGVDLGYVGQIDRINPEILSLLMQAGYIPIIAPIGISQQAQSFNINADIAASQIAMALKADHLIFLTDVPGVLKDIKDPTSKIDVIASSQIPDLISSQVLSGGMIPKAEGAVEALKGGVGEVNIIDGRIEHILLQWFGGEVNVGTTFKL